MSIIVLMLISQRAEVEIVRLLGTQEMRRNLEAYLARQRDAASIPLKDVVVLYVLGFIWEETKEIRYYINKYNFSPKYKFPKYKFIFYICLSTISQITQTYVNGLKSYLRDM